MICNLGSPSILVSQTSSGLKKYMYMYNKGILTHSLPSTGRCQVVTTGWGALQSSEVSSPLPHAVAWSCRCGGPPHHPGTVGVAETRASCWPEPDGCPPLGFQRILSVTHQCEHRTRCRKWFRGCCHWHRGWSRTPVKI